MTKKFTWAKVQKDYYAYYGEEELGFIEYYSKWKKWVWNQNEDIIMSVDCLMAVVMKLNNLEKVNPKGS